MKRLGVFCFFDKEGIVDDYILVLLDSLSELLNELIIVCNGHVLENEKNKLLKYSDEVIIRENLGYDAAAYKYVLSEICDRAHLAKYDSLVLFNSTFYGPFFNWNEIFSKMENEKVDFWGLSKAHDEYQGQKIDFVQSYFRVYEADLLHSDLFWKQWNEYNSPNSYKEVVNDFERGMSQRISEAGFKVASWLDYTGAQNLQKQNIYRQMSYRQLIGEHKFPVVKCKSISVTNYRNSVDTINYLKALHTYDVSLIEKHQARLDANALTSPYSGDEVRKFINSHKKTYIYGHGLLAKGLEEFLKDNDLKFEGFIVTKLDEPEKNVYENREIELEKEDGIIIAVGNILAQEIADELQMKYAKDQLLIPR